MGHGSNVTYRVTPCSRHAFSWRAASPMASISACASGSYARWTGSVLARMYCQHGCQHSSCNMPAAYVSGCALLQALSAHRLPPLQHLLALPTYMCNALQ
jgi:hypothetical protein